MSTPDPTYVEILGRLFAAEQAGEPVDALIEEMHARYLEIDPFGTTPAGLPYPDPTDPVAAGADAIRALAESIDTGRIPLPMVNGWTDYGGLYQVATYQRVSQLVIATGFIKGPASTANGIVANLPAGFRPLGRLAFAVVTSAGFGSGEIWSDGTLRQSVGGWTPAWTSFTASWPAQQ